MRRAVVLLLAVAWFATAAAGDPARHVDPFIGTGGHGHTFPGPTLPFGMVQLGPDTRLEGWDGCSGYHDSDRVVYGFSHTHLSGTGISDYGDILFMPVTGEPLLLNGYGENPDRGYASRFDKETEQAEAGWYAVELADYGVAVELTATERSGWHRYRFPAGEPAHVIVDLVHRDRVLDSSLAVVSDREIEGFRRSTGWADDQIVYFVARFSRPFVKSTLAHGEVVAPDSRALEGTDLKGILSFGDGGGELIVKVGLSAVDLDGARRNLERESPGWDFDAIRRAAGASWHDALGKIEVRGGTASQKTIFYTALYHSMIAPNLYTDVDGRYRGMDGGIHRAEDREHYTVFSLWDTFRATHPLYTLIEPDRTREFIETFLAQYEQGGRLPVWELAANETDTMIGYHSVSVIADAWVKGIRGFDEERALEAMVDSAMRDHFGLDAYRRQGFIGAEDEWESVSKTLEYAYDDWCIARMAEGIGRDDVAREFLRRSQSWRHLLDPETGFMRARANQAWIEPFDGRRVDGNYTEANAWQYSFFVPHDVEGLIDALGGEERFLARLDGLFEAESETTGRDQADITGLIGQYAHGNEPSHHMAWLYHYAGRPGESARRVGQILQTLYTAEPDGLSGNEDCGQMSSWYVFGAMGLYPVCPCSDEYVIGAPLFDRTVLHLEGDREFEIRRKGKGRFVTSARLNGEPISRSYLRHDEIVSGGRLELTLGAEPGPEWGTAPADRPNSRVEGESVLAAPFVRSQGHRFRDKLTVELASTPTATIHYITARGDRPLFDGEGEEVEKKEETEKRRLSPFLRYRGPIELRESTRLRFVAERDGRRSPEVEAYFHRIPNDWTVDVPSVPGPQYTAGGDLALIDGLRGSRDWRVGGWQGYRATDFEATVDLGATRLVRRAGASFLQDVRSWIWMPARVEVSVSPDGEQFREVARLVSGVPDDRYGMFYRDITGEFEGIEARYVRVIARGYGTIPDWHPGRGGQAWIFVDEILVE